jgi:uncharacterized protein YbjQ (UPF0145 family)
MAWWSAHVLEEAFDGLAEFARQRGAHAVVGVKIVPLYDSFGRLDYYFVYGTCLGSK